MQHQFNALKSGPQWTAEQIVKDLTERLDRVQEELGAVRGEAHVHCPQYADSTGLHIVNCRADI